MKKSANQKRLTDYFAMVEARGVEPLSENSFLNLSPSAVNHLKFPCNTAD